MEKVSDIELLEDIRNTELELHAYHIIAKGFSILSYLPELSDFVAKDYMETSSKYNYLASECDEFLEKLYALKLERSLS